MEQGAGRWTLEDLIDFESEIAAGTSTPPAVRDAVVAASRGLDGAAARRVGFRLWLDGVRSSSAGGNFMSALRVVGSVWLVVMFLAGVSGVLGMEDRARGGVHVTLFLVILIGGQWLILVFAAVAWVVRRRAAGGFSAMQELIGTFARRIAGGRQAPWWERLMREGGLARAAVLWRLGRMAQAAGLLFNVGALAGLAGLVLVKHVGFFWETTTEIAMHALLEKLTRWLSAPWAAWWPDAVPDAAVIERSRWMLPDRMLPAGPAEWWQFLLMTTLFWGLLPRLVLWFAAWHAGRRALGRLDFQSRGHRALWRDLSGTGRVETNDKPLDGVLVLDVGGSGLTLDGLRPFLLRRMRVHPAAWHPVAVLDPGAEAEVSRALAKAPAGVVLLAEGWALSPARMSALHARIRTSTGPETPVKFLVANSSVENSPIPPSPDERHEWERFVDSLRDPEAEVYFFENPQSDV